mgnify:CR=1 FL=1
MCLVSQEIAGIARRNRRHDGFLQHSSLGADRSGNAQDAHWCGRRSWCSVCLCHPMSVEEQLTTKLIAVATVSMFLKRDLRGSAHGGGESLVNAHHEEPITMASLEGTWGFEGGTTRTCDLEAPESSVPEFVVDADGAFHGTTGCNNIMGTLTLEDGAVDLGAIMATKMMCDERATAFEAEYLAVLGSVTNAEINGDALTLLGNHGAKLHYKRCNGAAPGGE